MDKIIDGVDVSGCEFVVKPINDNRMKCHCVKGLLQIAKMQEQPESIESGLCENNTYCYYKQLKRLEQENERLKAEIKYLEEEKKEKIQLLEQIIKILYPNASDDELFTVTFNSEYIDKLKNYKQALQEIKQKLDRVMTEEFTISEEWKPFELIDECRNKINAVIGGE